MQAKCAECQPRAQPRLTDGANKSLDNVRPALAGVSQQLPHLDRIQASFGRHDLSAVRTLTGGAAREASDQIGARAFTSGQGIAFRDAPDERLAAHESAHVIQQREGASAPGGGGGDPWERHADEVADAVVSGRSAEPLLDKVVGGDGARSPKLQLQQPAKDDKQSDANKDDAVPATVWGFTYRGLYLTDSAPQVRTTLETWAATKDDPHSALRELAKDLSTVEGVHSDVDSVGNALEVGRYCRPPSLATAKAEADPNKRIPKVVNEVVLQIINDDSEYIAKFNARALEIVNGLLDDGETHVKSELQHYGVRDPHVEEDGFFGFRVGGTIDDNKTTRGMGLAAEGLVARKKRLDAASERATQLTRQRDAQLSYYVDPRPIRYDDLGHPVYARGDDRPLPSYAAAAIASVVKPPAGLEDSVRELGDARRDYDVYTQQVQQMYPILASWSGDKYYDADKLQTVAKLKGGKNSDAAAVLITELGTKLVNIGKVRKGLKPGGDVNIWRVPKIIAGTRAQLPVAKGSLKETVLNKKVGDEQPSALTEVLIGILQFVLVLLAPFTEGLTLIPAAAISAGQAYSAYKEYALKEELHNTDFGAAALSAEEPSLFWLGFAIVAAGFDAVTAGGAAFKLFREIAPAAKAIRAGETGEQAAKNLANVERAAADAGGEALGKRVSAEAKAIQASGKTAGITAEEAAAFERVGAEAAAEELKTGAQGAANIAGGETKVSLAGDLWSCRSPCVMVRERYAALLEREPSYASRVRDLENRARNLAGKTGPEADAGRKAIANEAAALERELRTTAAPGDWTSPLKDSSEYDELVKRRGSVLPELDSHPPGWSGWDEARFRYGTAADEIPKGYTFALQENGELAVRRLDANLPPMRFNAATGAFEAFEENIVRAEANAATRQSKAFGELTGKTQTEMNDLLAQRKKLIGERDTLQGLEDAGTISEKQGKRLSEVRGQINDKSRLLGETAADELYKNAERVYPKTPKGSTSGDFDRVYKVGDEYHVVEAKGGASGLGTRTVGGEVVQQGTSKYLDDIIANMQKNPATRKMADELKLARASGKVKYVLVRAPIDTEAGAAALKRVYSVEFVLK